MTDAPHADANDAAAMAISSAETPENVEFGDGASKLKFVFNLLRRFVGVKDLVSLRLSLPANLMDPQSNLEFWNYQDRPDLFVAIPDGEDPLDRMLRTIRWWYSKDTKWKDNQLRKPYNPIIGEQFICSWPLSEESKEHHNSLEANASEATLAATQSSAASHRSSFSTSIGSTTSTNLAADVEDSTDAAKLQATSSMPAVYCATEQISHHPPIAAFCYFSHDNRIMARGLDHVIAKFTGMAFKVGPGEYNSGVYVTLPTHGGEEYNISHPWATVNGILTSNPYIVVSEQIVMVCPKTGLKAVLEYKEEPVFGRPKFAIEGKIFRYDYERDRKMTEKERREGERLNKIPNDAVLCTISGAWNGRITYRLTGSTEDVLLFDMHTSDVAPKVMRPIEQQSPLESRRVWQAVTDALLAKDYARATREKRAIEDRQRQLASEKDAHARHVPALFDLPNDDIFASSDIQGPPISMEKGKPSLKPVVMQALLSGRNMREVLGLGLGRNIEDEKKHAHAIVDHTTNAMSQA